MPQLLNFLWIAVSCVAVTSYAHADDWPQFRGLTGQGLAAANDLPTQWSESSNVAWKQSIPGKGWSSAVVHQQRIYLTTAIQSDHMEADETSSTGSSNAGLFALCLDAKSGEKLWSTQVFSGGASSAIHSKNSHASPTPLVHDDCLYVHFGHEGTAALDLGGNILWKTRELSYSPVHGNGGSPIVAGDLLIFSADGAEEPFVAALKLSSGAVRWKSPRNAPGGKNFSFSTPLLIDVNGQPQVISPGSNAVMAYDPETGREIWRVRYEGYSVIPRPVQGHGMIYISTGYDSPSVMAIHIGGSGDVTDTHVAWTHKKGAPNTPSLLLVDKELYMVSDRGIATCLDAKTGKVHWQERLGGNYSASPVHAAGRIYLQAEDGQAVVLRAGTEFKELARNSLGESVLSSYAISDESLYIRSETALYRIRE